MGSAQIAGGPNIFAAKWHGNSESLSLFLPAGREQSYGYAVSDDGARKAGYGWRREGQNEVYHAFLWGAFGSVDLHPPGASGSFAVGISPDGGTQVGDILTALGGRHAARWSGTLAVSRT